MLRFLAVLLLSIPVPRGSYGQEHDSDDGYYDVYGDFDNETYYEYMWVTTVVTDKIVGLW